MSHDIIAKPASPPDGSVVLGFTGGSPHKIDPDVARAVAHALLSAAGEAEHPRHDLYRSSVPPRPGQRAVVVDEDGRRVDQHVTGPGRYVFSVKSAVPAPRQEPSDEVWLHDGTGPFVRQVGYDVYRLCAPSTRGNYYLALVDANA